MYFTIENGSGSAIACNLHTSGAQDACKKQWRMHAGKRYAYLGAEGKLGKRKLHSRYNFRVFVFSKRCVFPVGWQLWDNIRVYFVLSPKF